MSALNETDLKELNTLELRMQNLYSTAKICPYARQDCDRHKEGLLLDPGTMGCLPTRRLLCSARAAREE